MKDKAFTPYAIRNTEIKNRIIRSATHDGLGNIDGTVSDAEVLLFERLARADIGMIITGHLSVTTDLAFRAHYKQPSIGDDCFIPGLSRLSAKVHEYDGVAIAQLSHAGPEGLTPIDFNDLSTEEMQRIRDWFIAAAIRAQKSGFDGVQLHNAHFYLLQDIVNVDRNRRTDQYGGSVENCIRLSKEIVEGIREECGDDFLILVKLNCHNTESGTDDFDLLGDYVDILTNSGVDLVEISGKDFPRRARTESLYYLDAAKYLRSRFPDVTMSLVGGISSAESIREALLTTDFASMSRAFLLHPDFVMLLKQQTAESSGLDIRQDIVTPKNS